MNIEIANRLIKLRKEKGLSQEALAEELGISRQAVSKWERAESSPDTDNLICLAKLYGISLDELLKTDDDINTIKEEQIKDNDTKKKSFVHIGKDGIHVVDDEDEVHISLKGIQIKDKEDEIIINSSGENKEYKPTSKTIKIINGAFPILCVIIFLLLGFFANLWHPGWAIFLLLPCWYTLFDAIKHRNPSDFAYPVFVTFIYIIFSSFFEIWHPLWVLFLTIPIYYIICDQIRKNS